MKIYGTNLSPYVVRPLLVCRHKGIDPQLEMPEGGLGTDSYRKINPLGKMPALVDGDISLFESQVIAEYIDDAWPEKPLRPADAAGRARVSLLSRLVDLYILSHLGGMFRNDPASEVYKTASASIRTALGQIGQIRTPSDHFAIGGSLTLADCTLAPVFFFLQTFDQRAPENGFVHTDAGLAEWWSMIQQDALVGPALHDMKTAMAEFIARQQSASQ